jgi:hypothetical protein
LASLFVVIAAAELTNLIGTRTLAHVVAIGVAHQAVIVALVLLRSDWLRHAILLVEDVAAPLVERAIDQTPS